MDLDLALC